MLFTHLLERHNQFINLIHPGSPYFELLLDVGVQNQIQIFQRHNICPFSGMDINKAAAHFEKGNFTEADMLCQEILSLNGNHASALHLRGVIAYQTNQFHTAIALLSRAHSVSPLNRQITHALAASYHREAQYAESICLYNKLCEQEPDNINHFIQLANVLEDDNQLDKASDLLSSIIQKFQNNPTILFNLSRILFKNEQLNNAERVVTQLLELENNNPSAWNLYGLIELQLNKLEKAEYCFNKAINIDNTMGIAYLNYASLLQDQGKFESAKTNYLKAISLVNNITPEISQAHYNMALIHLGRGEFEQGWEHLQFRPKVFSDIPDKNILYGKSILIRGEEGIGDELTFLRFIPELAKSGAIISYVGNPKLVPILSCIACITNLYTPENKIPDHDFQISAMDLPLILKINNVNSTRPIRLKSHNSSNSEILQQIANCKNKPVLGVTWRSGKIENNDSTNKYLIKNIPLEKFVEILSDFGGTVVILQRNPDPNEISYLKKSIKADVIDASSLNDDLVEMLSALQLIDFYLGVSNTNMHLFGSINKKACVLIPYPGEWRWMYSGESSPWYPEFTLIRQESLADWNPLIKAAKNYLNFL